MRGDPSVPRWNCYTLLVQMPHMAPGGRLSEIELLKWLGAFQWQSISQALSQSASRIATAHGERLYASFIDVELSLTPRHNLLTLGEDVTLYIANSVSFYAKKFVEGLFVISDQPLTVEALSGIENRASLGASGFSWACMTNAFIAREGSNTRLKVFKPHGTDGVSLMELKQPPSGVTTQARVQATGELEQLVEFEDTHRASIRRISPLHTTSVAYEISPENDLNGAGLVYFARYPAMMDYGDRIVLGRQIEPPVSTHLVSYLSTEHRAIFFFANASSGDYAEVRVTASLLLPSAFPDTDKDLPYRIPFHLLLRHDLHRASDRVLMASSFVRKALCVPGHTKHVLLEAERFVQSFR